MDSVYVNISTDFSLGHLLHNVLLPPLIPLPVPSPSIEIIVTQYWPPGYLCNQNKLTTTVKHKMRSIAQEGHDCGTLIPDITYLVPANVYYAIMWPFSSRKMAWSASTVKMDKLPVGCAQTIALPVLPMMTCGDPVSAPLAFVLSNWTNTVRVGMTSADFWAGVAGIAVSVAIDLVFHFISGGLKGGADAFKNAFKNQIVKQGFKDIAKKATWQAAKDKLKEEFFGKMFWPDKPGIVKRALGGLADFTTSLIKGSPTAKVGIGGGPLAAEVSVAFGDQTVGAGQVTIPLFQGAADTTGNVQGNLVGSPL
jgi:hypothetical protein